MPISGLPFDVSYNDPVSTFSIVRGSAIRRSSEIVLPGGAGLDSKLARNRRVFF
jgi:hypothetical protein